MLNSWLCQCEIDFLSSSESVNDELFIDAVRIYVKGEEERNNASTKL